MTVRTLTTVPQADDARLREALREHVDSMCDDDAAIVGYHVVVALADGRTRIAHDYSDNQRLLGAVEIARAKLHEKVIG
jgi:hypothetical protein